jgi:thiosulfate/3-mercaptopyruvate sulfurtransferase
MALTTLIGSQALATRLADPATVIVDCRFRLTEPGWGEGEYERRHIPGATYAHLDRDLSGTVTGSNGRHPLPDAGSLAQTLGRFGIGAGLQVVAYDQDNGVFASRLWWLLRWLGHEAVAVLDGGFARWEAEGRNTTSGREVAPARVFTGLPRSRMTANTSEVASILRDPTRCLVDARSPDRFRGENETLDKAAGHIPGAVNRFFQTNVDDGGRFRPAEELRTSLSDTLGDVEPERVVCYCGSGITACHNLLALEHAGLGGAKLYPGSWSEWSSDPTRPVETQ